MYLQLTRSFDIGRTALLRKQMMDSRAIESAVISATSVDHKSFPVIKHMNKLNA